MTKPNRTEPGSSVRSCKLTDWTSQPLSPTSEFHSTSEWSPGSATLIPPPASADLVHETTVPCLHPGRCWTMTILTLFFSKITFLKFQNMDYVSPSCRPCCLEWLVLLKSSDTASFNEYRNLFLVVTVCVYIVCFLLFLLYIFYIYVYIYIRVRLCEI